MKSISAVLNTRYNSTRLPGKALRPFCGTTLFEIALERLSKLDFFDCRFVGIGDKEFDGYVDKYDNVEVLQRTPESVSKGIHPQPITYAHFFRVPTKYIMILNICSPVLSIDTIRRAYDCFQDTNFNSYTAACVTKDWVFDSNSNPLTNKDKNNVTTNKNPNLFFYKATHSFHIINKDRFKKNGYLWSFTKDDPHCIEIPEEENVDVDTELDFKFAEFRYRSVGI